MDTSSKQQRTFVESKRERRKRNGSSKEVETGNWKSLNWESLKLDWKPESEKSEERKKKEDQKKVKEEERRRGTKVEEL
jgi:hypothetical protein